MNYDLHGRRALVTGSSRGIGSAIALELAKAGADIVVHCCNIGAKGAAVQAEIIAMGRQCQLVAADLSKPDAVAQLSQTVGDIDILVLNASVQIKKPWRQITKEDYETQMNCNYFASLMLIQNSIPYMIRNNWGRIVTIGSVQEAKPHPDMLVYSCSKCAQTGLVRSLATQLAEYRITINNVAPGVIDTDRNHEALSDETYAKKVTQSIPMGFYGEKEDCAGIVRTLCSDFGRYITGQSIYVDGGKSL
ncbi:MAG: SDR family NAD(P)-dependent oxidoreductase [Eubacteriales bacterium]|nr:SDR family NAD(P)-dependent oxidoreductase [Eubacteriales bacterium]